MTDKKCPACGEQAVVPIEYGYPAAYAVGRTEFLHETLYALAEVRELGKWYMVGQLFVYTLEPLPRPHGWPLPAERVAKAFGMAVAAKRAPLPGADAHRQVSTTSPGEDILTGEWWGS